MIIVRDRTSGENSPFMTSILVLVVTPDLSPTFGASMEI
jgi:hypothetical protein